jgi:hypothetical protein
MTEPDYTVLARANDIRAVVRIARMARHLAEDPATDRLAALCERTPPLRSPEYAAEFGHEPPLPSAAAEALLLRVWAHIQEVASDYSRDDAIAAMPFLATLDQLLAEKYGVVTP